MGEEKGTSQGGFLMMGFFKGIKVITGNANRKLAKDICEKNGNRFTRLRCNDFFRRRNKC